MTNQGNQSALTIARHLVRSNAKYFIAVWLLMLTAVAVATVVVGFFTAPDISIVDFAAMPPRYWLLAVGISTTVSIARIYIAHGVTRHHVGGGIVIAAVGISVLLAAMMAVAYGVEHLVYDANGWAQQASVDLDSRGRHLFDNGGQFGLVFTEFILVYLGHFFAGWTIGLLFTRFSVLTGILLILPAYLPAVLLESTAGSSWPGMVLQNLMGGTIPMIGVLAVAIPVLLFQVLLNRGMVLRMALKTKN